MSDPVITLDADRVSVEPGGQARVGVKITNPGTIVEGYRLEVLGHGVSQWAEAVPPEVSVYPKQDATATVVFSPPSGPGAAGGTWPFAVRARSLVEAGAGAVAEGDVEIGKVFGLQAKVVPVTSSGRWRGQHLVTFTNWGNSSARLRLVATDPDAALGFLIRPEVIDLPLGRSATARVRVRTRHPFLRGTPVRLPFTITGEPEGGPAPRSPAVPGGGTPERPVVDGAFSQKPIVSKVAVTVVAIALLAAAGGVAYALTHRGSNEVGLDPAGVPPKPKVSARATGPHFVQLTWHPILGVQSYQVYWGDQTRQLNMVPVDGHLPGTNIDKLPAGAVACFKVAAVAATATSPSSDLACVTTLRDPTSASPQSPSSGASSGSSTPPPSQTPSNTPSTTPSRSTGGPSSSGKSGSSSALPPPVVRGTFSGDKWAAVTMPEVEAISEAKRTTDLNAVRAAGYSTAGVMHRPDFPRMRPTLALPATTTWFVYVPFDDQASAQAACDKIRAQNPYNSCSSVQPEPKGLTTSVAPSAGFR